MSAEPRRSGTPSLLGAENYALDQADFLAAAEAEARAEALFRARPGASEQLRAYLQANPGRRAARTTGPKREGIRRLVRGAPDAGPIQALLAEADRRYWSVVVRHRRFVRRCAYQMRAQLAVLSEIEDLERICEAGAYVAAMRYDPSTGLRFPTYAIHWIRARVTHEREHPAGLRVQRRDALDPAFFLESLDERVAPMDNPDGEGRRRMDLLVDPAPSPDVPIGEATDLGLAQRLVVVLPDADRALIEARLAGRSLSDLGDEKGCTKEAIRQQETVILKRLSKQARSEDPHRFDPVRLPTPRVRPATKRVRARVYRDVDRGVSLERIQEKTGLSAGVLAEILQARSA